MPRPQSRGISLNKSIPTVAVYLGPWKKTSKQRLLLFDSMNSNINFSGTRLLHSYGCRLCGKANVEGRRLFGSLQWSLRWHLWWFFWTKDNRRCQSWIYPDVKNICLNFRIAFVEQWPPPLWQLWLSRRSVPASTNSCSLYRKGESWAWGSQGAV